MEEIVQILRGIKLDLVQLESEIVAEISRVLVARHIPHSTEVRVSQHCRVDLLTDSGIAIEVKKGKPNTGAIARQIERYAASNMVKSIILVSERGLFSHISEANGKPVEYVALVHNWGLTT